MYNCMYRGMAMFWSLVKMFLMPPSRSDQISSRLICFRPEEPLLPYELPPLLPPPPRCILTLVLVVVLCSAGWGIVSFLSYDV